MVNYYRRFLPGLSNTLNPLHAAVTEAGKAKSIRWTEQCEAAFRAAKDALVEATLLSHPNPFSQTALTVDASDVALGAELAQKS